MTTGTTTEQLTSTIDRLVRLTKERADLSTDISEILKEAESSGYDKAALKTVVKRAIKDSASEEEELSQIVETYWTAYLHGDKQTDAA